MLRSIVLALCAFLFVACATTSMPTYERQEPPPQWVSGELIVNFDVDPPEVILCIGRCDVPTQLLGIDKDTKSTLIYTIPDERVLLYHSIWLRPERKEDGGGSTQYSVEILSQIFTEGKFCRRWYATAPVVRDVPDPNGIRLRVQESEVILIEGCDVESGKEKL